MNELTIEKFAEQKGIDKEIIAYYYSNVVKRRINKLSLPFSYTKKFNSKVLKHWERLLTKITNAINDSNYYSIINRYYEEEVKYLGIIKWDEVSVQDNKFRYYRWIDTKTSLEKKSLNFNLAQREKFKKYVKSEGYSICIVHTKEQQLSINDLELIISYSFHKQINYFSGILEESSYFFDLPEDISLSDFAKLVFRKNTYDYSISYNTSDESVKSSKNKNSENPSLLKKQSESSRISNISDKSVKSRTKENSESPKLYKEESELISELLNKIESAENRFVRRSNEKFNELYSVIQAIDKHKQEFNSLEDKLSNIDKRINNLKTSAEQFATKLSLKNVELVFPSNHQNNDSNTYNLQKFDPSTILEENVQSYFDSTENKHNSSKKSSFSDFLKDKDLYYSVHLIKNFELTIKANRLSILKGDPGFGKTKLITNYVKYYYEDKIDDKFLNYTYSFIPVKPDWTDPSFILGNINYLTGEPEITDFVKIAYLAEKYPHFNFFVCFDEFNLARPENYFAPFLSIMELPPDDPKRVIEIFPSNFCIDNKPFKIRIGENLKFLCTINEDQSTFELSPKVKDRADLIDCNPSKDNYNEAIKEIIPKNNSDLLDIIVQFNKIWYKHKKNEAPPISYRLLDSIKNFKKSELDFAFATRILNSLQLFSFSDENQELKENLLSFFKTNNLKQSEAILSKMKTSIV